MTTSYCSKIDLGEKVMKSWTGKVVVEMNSKKKIVSGISRTQQPSKVRVEGKSKATEVSGCLFPCFLLLVLMLLQKCGKEELLFCS